MRERQCAKAESSVAMKRLSVVFSLLATALLVRISSGQEHCNQPQDCYPSGYDEGGITVPPAVVNCSDGDCECHACFVYDVSSGKCAVDEPCWTFSTSYASCMDQRRSQRTAVIFAALLSSVGAANFYVGRYEYAVPQLALFLCLLIASCFGRALRYVLDDKGRDTEKFCALCSTVCAAVVAILALATILAWWVADVIIFVRNGRTDGEDCSLREDL